MSKKIIIGCILAESYGAIYERNAINAAFPILTYDTLEKIQLRTGDEIEVDFETGRITKINSGQTMKIGPFSEVQKEIYLNGGLF